MAEFKYHKSKKSNTVDSYFGVEISDPYRWLENDNANETIDWINNQNKTTQEYLSELPIRNKIHKRMSALWNFEKHSIPFRKGDFLYYYKNDGLQNQDVLFRKNKDGKEEVFINPNNFSTKGTDSLNLVQFSENNKFAAYIISESGSDWGRVEVIDLESKKIVDKNVINVKFSNIAWLGNKGFYYSTYPIQEGSKLSAKTDSHVLFFHKLFTLQEEDEVIFGDIEKYRYVFGEISNDGRFLIISSANTTSGNFVFCQDLLNKTPLKLLQENENHDTYFIDYVGDELIFKTNDNALNNRIVKISFTNPKRENWLELISESLTIEDVSSAGGFLFLNYLKDVSNLVKQYDIDGKYIRDIFLQEKGTIIGFKGSKNEQILFFQFTNNTTPNSIYSFDVNNGKISLFWQPKVDFDFNFYESKQVFYSSKDGTKIPLTISYKKGLKLDGTNPTILFGYGGFNARLKPLFNIVNSVWLEMGGVYAVANIRGGGEYGKEWHNAGIKLKKQNVFDDFIAAAEFLIAEKYTSPKHLAIKGSSNGGLLVGVVMLQRPDLFQVALPEVGVLDMLRYHKFTAGAGWAYDYGTADESKEMFEYILKYSPLHNVKKGVKYPATLINTGDHDDRVVPAHSFKFAAELQEKASEENPIFIRIETDAGHGTGTSLVKTINMYSDMLSFTWHNLTRV